MLEKEVQFKTFELIEIPFHGGNSVKDYSVVSLFSEKNIVSRTEFLWYKIAKNKLNFH